MVQTECKKIDRLDDTNLFGRDQEIRLINSLDRDREIVDVSFLYNKRLRRDSLIYSYTRRD